jgi:hypothetical protein
VNSDVVTTVKANSLISVASGLRRAATSTATVAMGSSGQYVKENGMRIALDVGKRNGHDGNSPSREDDKSDGPTTASTAGRKLWLAPTLHEDLWGEETVWRGGQQRKNAVRRHFLPGRPAMVAGFGQGAMASGFIPGRPGYRTALPYSPNGITASADTANDKWAPLHNISSIFK